MCHMEFCTRPDQLHHDAWHVAQFPLLLIRVEPTVTFDIFTSPWG